MDTSNQDAEKPQRIVPFPVQLQLNKSVANMESPLPFLDWPPRKGPSRSKRAVASHIGMARRTVKPSLADRFRKTGAGKPNGSGRDQFMVRTVWLVCGKNH